MEDIFSFKRWSLAQKIIIPVNIVSIFTLVVFGYSMAMNERDLIIETVVAKANSIADFISSSSTTYVENYDVFTLERFVKQATKDANIDYMVFKDVNGNQITRSSSVLNQEDIFSIQRSIVNAKGDTIGSLEMGFNHREIHGEMTKAHVAILISVVVTQAIIAGVLLLIVRSFTRPLREVMSQLSQASDIISDTAHDLNYSSGNLSTGVKEQGAAVQQTVRAMEQMSKMIGRASKNVRHSEALSNKVADNTKDGELTMNDMVASMESIESSNGQLQNMRDIIEEIASKTKVINDIVFKTQLLSFNASIEAARAGQHGRGFAVVAEEVGNLAKLSGNAAKEISSLLEDSRKQVSYILKATQERVKDGRRVSENALARFNEISLQVKEISDQIQAAYSSSHDQESGVDQVRDAMARIDRATKDISRIAKGNQSYASVLTKQLESMQAISSEIRQIVLGMRDYGFDSAVKSRRSSSREEAYADAVAVTDDALDSNDEITAITSTASLSAGDADLDEERLLEEADLVRKRVG